MRDRIPKKNRLFPIKVSLYLDFEKTSTKFLVKIFLDFLTLYHNFPSLPMKRNLFFITRIYIYDFLLKLSNVFRNFLRNFLETCQIKLPHRDILWTIKSFTTPYTENLFSTKDCQVVMNFPILSNSTLGIFGYFLFCLPWKTLKSN